MLRTLKRLTLGFALVLAAYLGYRWGGPVFTPLERVLGIETPGSENAAGGPTPELAEETIDSFERFRAGELGDRLALGGNELTAVVRYAMPGVVPPGIGSPTVSMRAGDVHLSARVAVDAFPGFPELGDVVGILPDTFPIDLRGELVPLDQSHLALLVNRVQVARIPLPSRLVAGVLEGLGRERTSALPDDALRVPLPDGIERAYVQRDSLVLMARPTPTPGGRP